MSSTCKATVQIGPRKGTTCQFPPQADGYCGRHKRNKEYDERIAAGEKLCRFFFRGCNNVATTTSTSCESCLGKFVKKSNPCKHEGCRFKVAEGDYCGKHTRDTYRDEEKAKGIRYCDIARGCFSLCSPGKASCEECLQTDRVADKSQYEAHKALHECQVASDSPTVTCCYCGNEFEKSLTTHGKVSKSCPTCRYHQEKADAKRADRVRNYSEERRRNIQRVFDEYTKSSAKRGYVFELSYDDVCVLVTSPCEYCGHAVETEVNGIDRIDNSMGYVNGNVSSACWTCNRMKHAYSKDFFLSHCNAIITKVFPPEYADMYIQKSSIPFSQYRSEATRRRKLEWVLTKEQYTSLRRQPCYLCGYGASPVGIDRVDSTKGYIPENCCPCCFPCNNMKGEMPLEDFMDHIDRIISYNTTAENLIAHVPD